MIPIIEAALVAAMLALYLEQRAQRNAAREVAARQQAALAELLEELASLRSTLVASGAAERAAKLPPSRPEAPLPSVERKVVTVTRDDDPVHTRATVEAPAPAGWGKPAEPADEPPSTKPSTRPSASQARPRARIEAESSPIFESKGTVRARIEAAEDARERARARGELPPLPRMDEDDGRPTGEVPGDDEQTRVFSKRPPILTVKRAPATVRPPPHAPPRPRSERPTLFDGMLRSPAGEPAAPAAANDEMEGGAA